MNSIGLQHQPEALQAIHGTFNRGSAKVNSGVEQENSLIIFSEMHDRQCK